MNPGYDRVLYRSQADIDEGLRTYMLRVYNYLGAGVALSTITAYLTFKFNLIGMGTIASFATLGIMLVISFGFNKISAATMSALYWALTALMGVSLSYVLVAYTGVSVVRTLMVTAITFGVMSIYGYTTKRNLAKFSTFLLMGLVGILVASIVNIFLGSEMLHFIISVAGVLLFTVLIAFDTQQIKGWFDQTNDTETLNKMAVFGAVQLYVNLVNLFTFLLQFLGNRE